MNGIFVIYNYVQVIRSTCRLYALGSRTDERHYILIRNNKPS